MIDLATCPQDTDVAARTRVPDGTPARALFDEAAAQQLGLGETDPLLALEPKDLLAQFAATGSQKPFEEIVRRYGGMVFNVCLEVTHNRHDAEDATQAAFLSLAIQARSGQQVIAIGPWLQQVARRMSLDMNRSRKRRKNREDRHSKLWENRKLDTHDTVSGAANGAPPEASAKWDELRGIIQEELSSLPAKYRMPLILHYYGGMSRDEMAKELGCRTNTLGVRLHRAREMLGKRLAKRGVELSAVVVGLYLVEVVRSSVSQHMVAATAQAAAMLSVGKVGAASGLVSASVVELAQTAGRVVATAKFKLAAMLALVAGAAAAAGSEVMQHFQIDLPGRIKSLDLGRLLRPFWRSNVPAPQAPYFPGGGGGRLVSGHQDIVTPAGSGTRGDNDIELAGPAQPRAIELPSWGVGPIRIWVPRTEGIVISGGDSAVAGGNGGPVNRSVPGTGNVPLIQHDSPTAERKPKGGFGGGAGGGGGDAKGTGHASKDKSKDPSRSPRGEPEREREIVDREPKTDRPRGPKDNKPYQPKFNEQRHVDKKGRDDESNMHPGRGGVKQPDRHVKNEPPRIPPPNTPRPGHDPSPQRPGPYPPEGPYVEEPGGQGPVPAPTPTPNAPNENANHGDSGVDPNAPVTPDGGVLDDGSGRLLISSQLTPAGAVPSIDSITALGKGQAMFQLGSGEVAHRDVIVGFDGAGALVQTGGRLTVDSLYLAATGESGALVSLEGGQMLVTRSTPDAPHVLEIGGAGKAELRLAGGTIAETGSGTGASVVVGSLRAAEGTLRGWGDVRLSGVLSNNGKVIADGGGQARTLDLSRFTTIGNDHDNRTGGEGRGWYARNGGKLRLPSIAVRPGTPAQSYNWGEDAADDSIDLVNSARVTFTGGVDRAANLSISLLATDHADLPPLPAGHTFIGTWSFDLTGETGGDVSVTGGVDLQVRYDHLLAAELGLDEKVLKLWTFEEGQWVRHDFDSNFLRDPTSHTLSAHLDGAFSHFAVSAPEPGVIGVTVVGLAVCLGRRRRK